MSTTRTGFEHLRFGPCGRFVEKGMGAFSGRVPNPACACEDTPRSAGCQRIVDCGFRTADWKKGRRLKTAKPSSTLVDEGFASNPQSEFRNRIESQPHVLELERLALDARGGRGYPVGNLARLRDG